MRGFSAVRWLLKWGAIGAGITIGTAIIVFLLLSHFADTDPPRLVPTAGPSVERAGARGGAGFDYQVPEERTPRDPAGELDAPPITLIPERQRTPIDPVIAPGPDLAAFSSLVRRFLPAYETFRAGGGSADYRAGFAALVEADRLDQVGGREDSHAPPEIGPCQDCETGSLFTDQIDPGLYVAVRRYGSDSAYITTQGVVRYTGGGALAGRSFRRSYALLLSRDGGRWLVRRVASETLAPEASRS